MLYKSLTIWWTQCFSKMFQTHFIFQTKCKGYVQFSIWTDAIFSRLNLHFLYTIATKQNKEDFSNKEEGGDGNDGHLIRAALTVLIFSFSPCSFCVLPDCLLAGGDRQPQSRLHLQTTHLGVVSASLKDVPCGKNHFIGLFKLEVLFQCVLTVMIWCLIGVDSSADAVWPFPTVIAQELCLVLRHARGKNRHGSTTLYCHFVFAIWLSYPFCEEFFPHCSDSLLL